MSILIWNQIFIIFHIWLLIIKFTNDDEACVGQGWYTFEGVYKVIVFGLKPGFWLWFWTGIRNAYDETYIPVAESLH